MNYIGGGQGGAGLQVEQGVSESTESRDRSAARCLVKAKGP